MQYRYWKGCCFSFLILLWPEPLWNAWRFLVCAPWACLVMTQPSLTDGMSQTELQPQVSSATPPPSLSLWSGLTISERYFPKTGRKDWHLVSLLQLSVKQYPYHSGSLSEKGKEVVFVNSWKWVALLLVLWKTGWNYMVEWENLCLCRSKK